MSLPLSTFHTSPCFILLNRERQRTRVGGCKSPRFSFPCRIILNSHIFYCSLCTAKSSLLIQHALIEMVGGKGWNVDVSFIWPTAHLLLHTKWSSIPIGSISHSLLDTWSFVAPSPAITAPLLSSLFPLHVIVFSLSESVNASEIPMGGPLDVRRQQRWLGALIFKSGRMWQNIPPSLPFSKWGLCDQEYHTVGRPRIVTAVTSELELSPAKCLVNGITSHNPQDDVIKQAPTLLSFNRWRNWRRQVN